MLIFAAILAIFVYGMIAAMLGTILPDLSARFRLTPAQNGAIAFAQALGLMVASIAVGPLLDTQGDKAGLILGLIAIAAALFALPRARGFASIVALLFLLGVGGGIVVTGANALSSVAATRTAPPSSTSSTSSSAWEDSPLPSSPPISSGATGSASATPSPPSPSSPSPYRQPRPCPRPPAPRHSPSRTPAPCLPRCSASHFLLLLGLFLFLYVSCEVGVWNWLPRHLIAQGIPESRALNILSLGFALGLLVGRVGVSPILIRVPAVQVLLAASIAMAASTFLMLRTRRPGPAAALVFIAGLAMAPVFPTTLAIVGTAFPAFTGTAIGFAITCGWAGLAVSSRIIGALAGDNPQRLQSALLLIPASSVLMIGLSLAIQSALR